MQDDWSGTYESVPLGATSRVERKVDEEAIYRFADAVQSFHPIHMSRDWVRANTAYTERLAHGLMTSALMSRPIVDFCRVHRIKTVLVSSAAKYVRPVFAGDTVTTTLTLVEKVDARRRIRFDVVANNQKGEVVMTGEVVEQVI